ncbi:putative reverse transcriptase zinc-binding domain-containing protein [Helianthus annuus]|nr:putative reverse transcriptase zinc-binding domain-containing protein [Helianthus annuus]
MSGVWKNITNLESRVLIKGKRFHCFIKGVLGNGKSIYFWLDKWYGDVPLMVKGPRLFAIEEKKDCRFCDRLPEVGGSGSWNWSWSKNSLKLVEAADLEECQSLLCGVIPTAGADKWSWTPDNSGIFSTASVKALSEEVDNSGNSVWKWKGSWIPSKCKIFIWRSNLGRIPTRNALARRDIQIDSEDCILCSDASETVDHIFSACEVSLRVWHRLSVWAKIPPIFAFSFKDLLVCHKGAGVGKKAKEIVRGLILVTCWCIWKARNDKCFSNGRGNSDEIFGEVKSLGFLWLKCRSKHRNIDWRDWCNYSLYML